MREAVGADCAIVAGFCLDSFNDETDDAFKVTEDGIAVVQILDDLVDLWDVQVGSLEDDVSSSRFFPPSGSGSTSSRSVLTPRSLSLPWAGSPIPT